MAMTRLGAVLVIASVMVLGCQSGEPGSRLGGEETEQVQLPQINVNLPSPPSFQKEHAPESYPDSSYSVYGLRKGIGTLLNKEVRVKGYLLEVYECPPCAKGATCTCLKPHFYLADRANGPKEGALMVTDYPKEDPTTKKKTSFDLGMQYYVTGKFTKFTDTGFSKDDGVLVYKDAKRVSAE